jgi:5-bromo-4-chloroindolyl phosphate hydrolysis protein
MDSLRLKVEMEGIRYTVMSHMSSHHEEINQMVQDTLAQTLTEDWVKASIQENVDKCLQNAINSLGDNWQLRNAVSNVLSTSLSTMIEKKYNG